VRCYIADRYGPPLEAKAFWLCVPLGTMILTRQGWKSHDEVQVGDETIGFNPHTGRSEWTAVLALHHYESAPLMWLRNQRVSLVSTPNHRWVTKHWVQPWIPGKGRQPAQAVHAMTETQAITSRHAIRLAAKADTGNGLSISDDEAELLGWILGDGSVKAAKGRVVIYQNKPKYLPHLEAPAPAAFAQFLCLRTGTRRRNPDRAHLLPAQCLCS
jgi:hypothetical protein